MQPIQVAVLLRSAAFVEFIKLAVEPKEGSKNVRIQKVDDRIQLVDPVLDWRAAEHECVPALQPFDCLCSFCAPVLDPLCFIEDHDIGAKSLDLIQRLEPVRCFADYFPSGSPL